jgi:hypothetical protein
MCQMGVVVSDVKTLSGEGHIVFEQQHKATLEGHSQCSRMTGTVAYDGESISKHVR